MTARNIEAIHGLTSLQEGMLFHTLEAPTPGVYHSQFSCRIEGDFDPARFEDAWARVAARHGALRTLFTWEGRDKPLQIVRERADLPWQRFDWRELDRAQQERRFETLLASDRDRGFDLEHAPLARCLLASLGEASWRFVFSFHHLILDGWSMRLVLDEALSTYAALGEGKEPALPPAPDFGDFIALQAQRNTEAEQTFWREHLAGFATPTTVAVAKFDPPPAPGTPNSVAERRIGAPAHRALADAVRRRRVTLNTLVLGAWSVVLARYAQRDDVVFGTTVSGRTPHIDGVEHMAGLLINTLPLRVQVAEDRSCDDFLQALQADSVRQRAFELTPLVEAQRASGVAPGTPLFDTIVVFENFPARAATATGLALLDERFDEYSNFPFALLVVPEDTLRLIAVYDPARFDATAATALLDQVAHLLDELVRDPPRRLGDLALLDAGQIARVIDGFNDTRADFGPPLAAHRRIEAAAARSPDAVAVVSGETRLSYAELDAHANRIARALRARGVAPGQPVVVFAERRADTVAAIVGVHKAGGAYVPVDPKAPRARLAKIVADVGIGGPAPVVTHASLADRLPEPAAALLLDGNDLSAIASDPVSAEVPADSPAYVMYTSGSTGVPKGVQVSHCALYNSTRARDHRYPEPPTAFLVLSSLATDSSVAGLFWSLSRGGTLVLPGGRAEQDMQALAELIAREGVSHVLCVPSLHALLLEHAPAGTLASLRAVMVAGEACPAGLPETHAAILPGARLYNEYGPTEATVWASVDELAPGQAVTIGRPIANTRLYVLDAAQRALPVGVTGELCIGGAQLADGYFQDADATRAVFLPDPFAAPGGRLYRTGDRARWRPDGRVDFLGRADDQIKVRGYRVEPGEIEAALTAFASISEAVVFLDEDPDDDALGRALDRLDAGKAQAWLKRLSAMTDAQVETALRGNEPGPPE